MICCTETSKQKIASTLLAAFSMVYLTAFLCDFEIYNVHDYIDSKEHVVSKAHDHGHMSHGTTATGDHHDSHKAVQAIQEEAHDHASHNHDEEHEHSGDAEDDDCCTDDTHDIMDSFFSESIDILDLHPVYHLSHAIPSIEMTSRHAIDIFNVNNIYYDLPPPDGGMHRRILIQSFLN